MRILSRPVLTAILVLTTLQPLAPRSQAAPPHSADPVVVSAALGTVATAWVKLDNALQPAAEVLLYEAFEPAAATAGHEPAASLRVPLPNIAGPLAPGLLEDLAAAPDGQGDMLIYLTEQADLSAAAAVPGWNERGAAVAAALQAQAAASQGPLLAALRAAGYAPRPYWIVNMIAVSGDASLAAWAAGQPEVALVTGNTIHTLDVGMSAAAATSGEDVAWGVNRIRAPSVWGEWGVRGAGIVVANLDTGVAVSHTALLTRYRGWSPEGMSHDYNWFDAAGEPASPVPVDQAGHGTHTMGTIVGGATEGWAGLGVAPSAAWIAVRGCQGIICSDEALIRGAQWLLAPTTLAGTAPRPDLRPHIINNSWGKPGEDAWYLGYVTAWNAAGIFSVFAAGNSGVTGACQTTTSPGNYPGSLAVGATDSDDAIADFSSRGPAAGGVLKPEVSAPGVSVPSAWPDGGVRNQSGTSMAAPHVAGVAALLWSANPALLGDLDTTRAALMSSALPRPTAECGTGGLTTPNNVYGWGRVDARSAVEAVRVDIPWLSAPASANLPADSSWLVKITLDARQVAAPGTYRAQLLVAKEGNLASIPITFEVLDAPGTATLTGALIDTWRGQPVYGRVRLGGGPEVQTDLTGHFTATVPTGAYVLTAEATGHLSVEEEILHVGPSVVTLTLTPDLPHLVTGSTDLSADLEFAERITLPFTVTNAGTQPLSLTAATAPLEWVVTAAGEPAGPLYDLSAFAPLSLTDDMIHPEPLLLGFDLPIHSVVVRQVYLSSNGFVSGVRPTSAAPFPWCLPIGSLPPLTLAPFWADLDPSRGGAVRAGQVTSDTFVVSFEAVPPWQDTPTPNPPTYTFQVAMHSSGLVEYLFGEMAAPPARWSMGMSHNQTRGQSLACYRAPAELTGRSWRMRNQPLPTLWLGVAPAQQWVAPGETITLEAKLAGYGYAAWHPNPFLGPLVITSNDPAAPRHVLTATATIGPAAHAYYYPVIAK